MSHKEFWKLQATIKLKLLWNKACEFEGIPSESKFVAFSDKNIHAKAYNALAIQVLGQ